MSQDYESRIDNQNGTYAAVLPSVEESSHEEAPSQPSAPAAAESQHEDDHVDSSQQQSTAAESSRCPRALNLSSSPELTIPPVTAARWSKRNNNSTHGDIDAYADFAVADQQQHPTADVSTRPSSPKFDLLPDMTERWLGRRRSSNNNGLNNGHDGANGANGTNRTIGSVGSHPRLMRSGSDDTREE